MILGLVLQAVAITGASLLAFWIGLHVFASEPVARTMAFVMLSGCQLARAYTNRSERASLFSLGVFSNRWMQYAAVSSVLLLAVVYVPGLNVVFNATPLSAAQWARARRFLSCPPWWTSWPSSALRARDRAPKRGAVA